MTQNGIKLLNLCGFSGLIYNNFFSLPKVQILKNETKKNNKQKSPPFHPLQLNRHSCYNFENNKSEKFEKKQKLLLKS